MNRPDLKIAVMVGETSREVKWTYGLSTDIQRLVPTVDAALSHLQFRPEIRDYVLRRCLTDRKGFVMDESALTGAEEIDQIEPEAVLKVLDWVQGHLLYFFGTSAESTHTRATALKDVLGRLNLSTPGSPDSVSMTPVAGPSE